MDPWWLVLIVPVTFVSGMIGFVLLCWFTRNIFQPCLSRMTFELLFS